jgi:molybdate transport system regulatory protein
MKLKFNLWLEVEDEVALSLWRVRLLTAVAQTGSINRAAAQMRVPYRIAWQKIHEMEERLGQKLVETQTGGQDGGGSQLTPLAQSYIEKFTQISQEVEALVQTRFQETFNEIAAPSATNGLT